MRKDPLVLIVNRENPLAKRDSISLQDARNEKFCFPREDTSVFNFFCDSCSSFGFVPKLTLSDVRLGTIKRYILAGMRSTLQVKVRAENFFYEQDFKIIELEEAPILTLAMLTNKEELNETVEKFVKYASGFHDYTPKEQL
jgi:phage tail tube protein FII